MPLISTGGYRHLPVSCIYTSGFFFNYLDQESIIYWMRVVSDHEQQSSVDDAALVPKAQCVKQTGEEESPAPSRGSHKAGWTTNLSSSSPPPPQQLQKPQQVLSPSSSSTTKESDRESARSSSPGSSSSPDKQTGENHHHHQAAHAPLVHPVSRQTTGQHRALTQMEYQQGGMPAVVGAGPYSH
jgi:hypothetical protein